MLISYYKSTNDFDLKKNSYYNENIAYYNVVDYFWLKKVII